MGASAIFCKGARTGAVLRVLLVDDHEAIRVLQKQLDAIPASVPENEEMTGQGIFPEDALHEVRQPVESFP